MIILLGEGLLADADGNDSATCTCAQQDAEWLAYVDDLQRPETRKVPEDENPEEKLDRASSPASTSEARPTPSTD